MQAIVRTLLASPGRPNSSKPRRSPAHGRGRRHTHSSRPTYTHFHTILYDTHVARARARTRTRRDRLGDRHMHMFMKTWPSHMGSTPLVGRRTSSWHLAARHAGCAEDGAYMRMVHHGERSRPCHSNLSALPSALDSIMRGWDKGGPCTQTTLVGRPPKAKRRPEGARRGSECTCPTAPQEVEAAVAADDGHAATAQR